MSQISSRTPKGRLGRGALEAFRWGVTITHNGFELPDRRVSVREEWFVARKVILAHLKQEQARRLALRRPTMYAGLSSWNPKQHSKLLCSLPPLKAKVLWKLWAGSIMCKHKRQQLYGESPQCACGHADQTVQHLLWNCPLVPPPPVHLEHRRRLPPSQSVSHLLPAGADRVETMLWKESCIRALQILSDPTPTVPQVREEPDMKGHIIRTSEDGTYAFCRKCFITRRARDRKWIWTKRCAQEQEEARMLGDTWVQKGTKSLYRWLGGRLLPCAPDWCAPCVCLIHGLLLASEMSVPGMRSDQLRPVLSRFFPSLSAFLSLVCCVLPSPAPFPSPLASFLSCVLSLPPLFSVLLATVVLACTGWCSVSTEVRTCVSFELCHASGVCP